MDLLILISGKINRIIEANNLNNNELEIIKLDEKDFIKFQKVKKIINNQNYEHVFFGCIELELQRFQAFIMLIILMSEAKNAAIIDEAGNKKSYNRGAVIFQTMPKLFIEVIVSIFIVFFYHIKLPVLKWLLLKK